MSFDSNLPRPISKSQRDMQLLAQQVMSQLDSVRQDWMLSNEQLPALIELPPQTLTELQADPCAIYALAHETQVLEHIEDLFHIATLLEVLFDGGVNARDWVNKPNSAPLFGGQTALDYMLANPGEHRSKVIGYLVNNCSGQFS